MDVQDEQMPVYEVPELVEVGSFADDTRGSFGIVFEYGLLQI
jgi:hypothetical protein